MLPPIWICTRMSDVSLDEPDHFSQPFPTQQVDCFIRLSHASCLYWASVHLHRAWCATGKLVWALDPRIKQTFPLCPSSDMGNTFETETCPWGIWPGWKQTMVLAFCWLGLCWCGWRTHLLVLVWMECHAMHRGGMRKQPRDWVQPCLMWTWFKHKLFLQSFLLFLSRTQFLVSPRILWGQWTNGFYG